MQNFDKRELLVAFLSLFVVMLGITFGLKPFFFILALYLALIPIDVNTNKLYGFELNPDFATNNKSLFEQRFQFFAWVLVPILASLILLSYEGFSLVFGLLLLAGHLIGGFFVDSIYFWILRREIPKKWISLYWFGQNKECSHKRLAQRLIAGLVCLLLASI